MARSNAELFEDQSGSPDGSGRNEAGGDKLEERLITQRLLKPEEPVDATDRLQEQTRLLARAQVFAGNFRQRGKLAVVVSSTDMLQHDIAPIVDHLLGRWPSNTGRSRHNIETQRRILLDVPSPWSHRKKVPKTALTLFLVSGVHFGFARILRRSSVVTDSGPSGLSFRIFLA